MATHDYVIANGTGAAVRSDLNGALAAIVSQNSSATEPSPSYAYQRWADTTAGVMKMRNGANNAWISLYELDGTFLAGDISLSAGAAATPSLFFTGDTNTGIYSPGADQLAISTGGTSRLAVSTTAVSSTLAVDVPLGAVGTPSITFTGDLNTGVFSPGADTLALVTGGTNRVHVTSGGLVGIGTTSPGFPLQIGATGSTGIAIDSANSLIHGTFGSGGNLSLRAQLVATAGGGQIYLGGSTRGDGDVNAIVFSNANTEKARLDSSGRLLVGTSTSSMSGGTVQQNGNLGIIANNATNVSNNGTLDIVINSDGSCYSGFLIVENTLVASAATRTQATYSVLGRGTSATATSIATLNGSTAAASFTLTYPSNGTIRITNTCGGDTNINLVWFGPRGY